jgi:2-dehydro-3-deoxyphosphogluconate aldolase / (4S)-4-hydroxy-2-oxoglutarate aldolase
VSAADVAQQLRAAGLIAIVRADSAAGLVDAAHALWSAGVRAMEITLNTPRALETIGEIRETLPEMLCGVGTVLEMDDGATAVRAGAQFVITPTLQLDTIAMCQEAGVPVCPGCASPTEMLTAHRAGADFIKVFPAGSFGLRHMKAILEAMPQLRLVPTGGVTPENLADYFRLGCPAVAVGSNLVSRTVLAERDWAGLKAAASRFVNAVAAARTAIP